MFLHFVLKVIWHGLLGRKIAEYTNPSNKLYNSLSSYFVEFFWKTWLLILAIKYDIYGPEQTFLVIKKRFTLAYPKQHLRFAMVTTKNRLQNSIINLSKEYWKVKQQNGIPSIKWKVLKKYQAYNQKKRQCILYLNEKYEIVCYKRDNLLNKRTEILGICSHRNKYKFKNCDSKDWHHISIS